MVDYPTATDTLKQAKRPSALTTERKRAGYTMLLPALIIVCGITLFPIVYSIWMSLNHVTMTTNGYQMQFAGLANYNKMVHAGEFWHSVWFTFYYSVVTVFIELTLGLLIALAIDNVKRLKNVSIVIMLIPWALITVIAAEMWDYIDDATYGVLNAVLQAMHLIPQPYAWLSNATTAVIAMMVADIWKTTPFVVVIILAGLQMISNEYLEAAYIDGANSWQVFWKVTFPLLRGSIALAALFRILQAFGVFDLPFVLTSGGPGTATQSLAILADQVLFQELHIGVGSAVTVATVLIVLAISLVFVSVFRSLVVESEA